MGGVCVTMGLFELEVMKIFILIAGDLCLHRTAERNVLNGIQNMTGVLQTFKNNPQSLEKGFLAG